MRKATRCSLLSGPLMPEERIIPFAHRLRSLLRRDDVDQIDLDDGHGSFDDTVMNGERA